jgi:hypothetical protein
MQVEEHMAVIVFRLGRCLIHGVLSMNEIGLVATTTGEAGPHCY